MQQSKIEWTEKTWNPVTGCTKVSQGCKFCYAERLYERWHGKGSFKNVQCHPERLSQPLKWKAPATIFVNSMSDLFHEDVPFSFIDRVFAIMNLSKQHIFQIHTKRHKRMLEYFEHEIGQTTPQRIQALAVDYLKLGGFKVNGFGPTYEHELRMYADRLQPFPMKNVWLGVSVEDQKAADERIPLLLQIPAAVRFLSCEPLIGPVDLFNVAALPDPEEPELKYRFDAISKGVSAYECEYPDGNTDVADGPVSPGIDWVIVGGESGPGHRPMELSWATQIMEQCRDAEVPFFMKQIIKGNKKISFEEFPIELQKREMPL